MRLQNKIAIVTGAASGIGKEIAVIFAREGVLVAIADLNRDAANAAAREVDPTGKRAIGVSMDVTDEKQVDAGTAKVIETFGALDVLVSNAGIQIVAPIVDFEFAKWKQLLAIHLDGAFLTTRAALRQMYKQRSGNVIYMGSVHSKEASVLKAPYVTAKHGLIGLAKVVAKEGAAHGVRANVCHNTICRDIGVQVLKAGHSFSRLCLSTDPANCLCSISITCGRSIRRLGRACRSKRMPSASCRTISMPFGHCLPAMPISRHVGVKSKVDFPRGRTPAQLRSRSQVERRETGIWQRRFWEHLIRDDADFQRHVDYIHFNPVKHGYVTRVCDWPHSSFHRYVKKFVTARLGRRSRRDPGPLRATDRVRKIAPRPCRALPLVRRFCAPYGAASRSDSQRAISTGKVAFARMWRVGPPKMICRNRLWV
jgi:NAD(P)-dependent dehydrogenase (short-subunit alcohol dehydrogenase family)